MTPCDEYIIKMNQYLDGELPDREVADLFRHVEQCSSCHRRFESLRIISAQMQELEEYPPEDLHSRIMAGIKKDQSSRRRRKMVRTAGTVAACALIAVALFSGMLPGIVPEIAFDSAENGSAPRAAENMNMAPAPESAYAASQQKADTAAESAEDTVQDSEAEEPAQSGQLFPNSMLSPGTEPDPDEENTAAGAEQVFILPQLQTSEGFAAYCIATGTGALPEIFEPGAVIEYPDYGETYIFVENDGAAFTAARDALETAGFTVWEQVENLPETDPAADRCLIVIFAQ